MSVIDMLPKDLSKLIKDLLENLNAKKHKEFIDNLQKNANYYSLKVQVGEKKKLIRISSWVRNISSERHYKITNSTRN